MTLNRKSAGVVLLLCLFEFLVNCINVMQSVRGSVDKRPVVDEDVNLFNGTEATNSVNVEYNHQRTHAVKKSTSFDDLCLRFDTHISLRHDNITRQTVSLLNTNGKERESFYESARKTVKSSIDQLYQPSIEDDTTTPAAVPHRDRSFPHLSFLHRAEHVEANTHEIDDSYEELVVIGGQTWVRDSNVDPILCRLKRQQIMASCKRRSSSVDSVELAKRHIKFHDVVKVREIDDGPDSDWRRHSDYSLDYMYGEDENKNSFYIPPHVPTQSSAKDVLMSCCLPYLMCLRCLCWRVTPDNDLNDTRQNSSNRDSTDSRDEWYEARARSSSASQNMLLSRLNPMYMSPL